MANKPAVVALLEGVEAWNQFVKEQGDVRQYDFSGGDLEGGKVIEITPEHKFLRHANFAGCPFRSISPIGLQACFMQGADFIRCSRSGLRLCRK